MANIIFSEGSGVNDGKFGKVQTPIRMMVEKKAELFEKQSMIPVLFKEVSSKHFAENYRSDTAMGNWEGVGENGDPPTLGYEEAYDKTIKNMTFKGDFYISREMIDDGNTAEMKRKPANFVTAYHRTREDFAAHMYGAAITGSSFNAGVYKCDAIGADGKNLFATDHPLKETGGTVTNKYADDVSNDAILYMEAAMQDFRDDSGNVLDIRPDTILIPNDPLLKKKILGALGADKDPDVAASNAFNFTYGRFNIVIWGYLNQYVTANTHPWIMLDSSYLDNYGGAIWQNRVPLEVTSTIEHNDANRWHGYSRFGAGFTDFRFACIGGVSGGSTLLPVAAS